MSIIKCRCGQSLKVNANAGRFRCPSCQVLLQLKVPKASRQAEAASAANVATASMPTADVKARCPCGAIATISNEHRTGTCGSCGTTLRLSTKSQAAIGSLPRTQTQSNVNQRHPPSTQAIDARMAFTETHVSDAVAEQASVHDTTSWEPRKPPRPTARPGPQLPRRPAKPAWRPKAKWIVPVSAAAVGLLVLGGTSWFVIAAWSDSEPFADDSNPPPSLVTANDSTRSLDESKSLATTKRPNGTTQPVRIGTYPPGPRFPYTTEFLEKDFIDTLRYPIGKYVDIVPPEKNAAPDYILALAQLDADLAEFLPAGDQSESRQSARRLTQLLDELTVKRSRGEAYDFTSLRQFDTLIEDLVEAQKKPEFSLLAVPLLEQRALMTRALERLNELSMMRIANYVQQGELDPAIGELAVLARIADEAGRDATIGTFLSGKMRRSIWSESLPRILRCKNLKPAHTRALLDILLSKANRPAYANLERASRAGQLWPLRFIFDIEHSSPSQRKSYAEQIVQLTRFGQVDMSEEANEKVKFFHGLLAAMDAKDFELNRNGFIEMTESAIEAIDGTVESVVAGLADVDREMRARKDTTNRQVEAALAAGDFNSTPWLMQLLLPSTIITIEFETMVITLERVAVVQTALQHAELGGQSISGDLSRLPSVLSMDLEITDPYSGEPLKVVTAGGESIVYSVGPDGADDLAGLSCTKPSEAGDIFVLKR